MSFEVEDLFFIVGSQIATAGVLLAHLGTDLFSTFYAEVHSLAMLLVGGVLIVGGIYYSIKFGQDNEVTIK